MHAGNLAHAVDDVFQMLQVSDIEHDVNVGLAIAGAGLDVTDVGLGVADDGGDLFQHPKAIVAEDGEFHRVSAGGTVVLGPLDINLALGLIQQVGHIGTVDGMHRDPFAASDVAHDGLASNRVTTAGAVNQQVAVSFYASGVVVLVAAESAPDHAGQPPGLLFFLIRQGRTGRRRHASQDLPRRIFAVADARHQVVGAPCAVVGGDLLPLLVLDVLERYAILAGFFLDQLAANLDGTLPLMDVEPVLDLVARAG